MYQTINKSIYIHTIEKAMGVNSSFDLDLPGEAQTITHVLFVVIPYYVNMEPVRNDTMLLLPGWMFEFGRISLRAMKNRMVIDNLPVKYIPSAYHWNGLTYELLTTVAQPPSFTRDSIQQNIPVGCGVNVMYHCTLDYTDTITSEIFNQKNYDLKIILKYQ
jgi:hypothetical protein